MASGNNSISQHLQAGVTSQKSKELYLSEGIAFYEARQYQLALTACSKLYDWTAIMQEHSMVRDSRSLDLGVMQKPY